MLRTCLEQKVTNPTPSFAERLKAASDREENCPLSEQEDASDALLNLLWSGRDEIVAVLEAARALEGRLRLLWTPQGDLTVNYLDPLTDALDALNTKVRTDGHWRWAQLLWSQRRPR